MANLHLVTGYAGTAHITSDDHGSFNAAIIGDGSYVLNRGNTFAITVVTNNQIRISDGDILFQGRHIRLKENTYVDLAIENGAQGMYRNDLVVCRYTKDVTTAVEEANLVVIKGTASTTSNPTDPEYISGDLLTNHDLTVDFPLYRIPINGVNVQTPVALFDVASGGVASKTLIKTITVPVSATWTTDTTNGGYMQVISVQGIVESDDPIYDVVLGADVDANAIYLEAFASVTRLTTSENKVTLWANKSLPSSAFTLKLKVVR